jgi:hypothetical protein
MIPTNAWERALEVAAALLVGTVLGFFVLWVIMGSVLGRF